MSESKKNSKYFKIEEANETLTDASISSTVAKKKYTYKTGAIYDGEWLGGLRHGFGTMTWADGAKYEGQWNTNQACGRGKFYHTYGD